jgi:serine phosphatase RsbU (regulator of sigma subunit)
MRLSAINLPGWQPVQVAADKASIVGRSSQSDIVIPDPRVSGRHALFEFKGGRWTITDLASKHGVRVQGVVAAPNRPVEIVAGDLVHLGPVAMRFGEGSATTTISRAFDDGPGTIIAPPTPGQGPALTQKMIEAIAGVIAATHDRELAQRLADLTVDLSCYPRVAVLDVPSAEIGEVRVLAAAPLTSSVSTLRLSRSLVRSAMDGQLVVLRGDEVPTTHSIMSLDIKEACCAPIRVGDTTIAFLYADARGIEGTSKGLSYEVVRVLAQIGGVAWGNLQRAELSKRQQQLERDLEAARRVQERMMPDRRGTVAQCEYALECQAGRMVAGDLVDVFALPSGKIAMLLGDVMDKGAGAALLMALLQTQARSMLSAGMGACEVMAALNRDVAERFQPAIASLWLAIWDGATLETVDAGHGYCALHSPIADGNAEAIELKSDGGTLLGADADTTYTSTRITPAKHSRLVLFSDGIPEQRDANGEQFGTQRVLSALRTSPDPASDVEALIAALEVWAGGRAYADDVSVLAVTLH